MRLRNIGKQSACGLVYYITLITLAIRIKHDMDGKTNTSR